MSQYLGLLAFRDATLAPPGYIDTIEASHPGWVDRQLVRWSAWIDARLSKRYATPFDAASPPMIVEEWLARIVTHRCYLKRGVDPKDAEVAAIIADAEEAKAEIAEAATASATANKFELPLRADAPGYVGVVRGAPLGYAEESPYTWAENQYTATHRKPFTPGVISGG